MFTGFVELQYFPSSKMFSMRCQHTLTTHFLGSLKPQIGVVRVSQRTQLSLIRSSQVWQLAMFDSTCSRFFRAVFEPKKMFWKSMTNTGPRVGAPEFDPLIESVSFNGSGCATMKNVDLERLRRVYKLLSVEWFVTFTKSVSCGFHFRQSFY